MKLNNSEKVHNIVLPAISGDEFNSSSLSGQKYMISFFRFASCPFCNLRVHQLVKRYSEFGNNFSIVAIFDSPLNNLIKYTTKHQAVFPILADESNKYYHLFGIKKSVWGMFSGMLKRFPTLMKSIFVYGNVPLIIKGSMITMPADFLVDENGYIVKSYFGKDEGDHLPIDEVIKFSRH